MTGHGGSKELAANNVKTGCSKEWLFTGTVLTEVSEVKLLTRMAFQADSRNLHLNLDCDFSLCTVDIVMQ